MENKRQAQALADADVARLLKRMSETGQPMSARSVSGLPDYSAIQIGGNGMAALCMIEIGARGNLTKRRAREHAVVFKETRRASPGAEITIGIAGYDDDPRELWDFPEVRRYVRWWSRAAGLGSWQAAIAVPWANFDAGMHVLVACNVFGDEHPFDLRRPDAARAN